MFSNKYTGAVSWTKFDPYIWTAGLLSMHVAWWGLNSTVLFRGKGCAGAQHALCRASIPLWPLLRWFGLCRASFKYPIVGVLVYPLWLFMLLAFVAAVYSPLPKPGCRVICTFLITRVLLQCCLKGWKAIRACCSWSPLPMLSRLACPVGWLGWNLWPSRLCIFDIRYELWQFVFSTRARWVVWYCLGFLTVFDRAGVALCMKNLHPWVFPVGMLSSAAALSVRCWSLSCVLTVESGIWFMALTHRRGGTLVGTWPEYAVCLTRPRWLREATLERQSVCRVATAAYLVCRLWTIWLILPVVICLSQRLSHACLSTDLQTVKPRMAH